MQTEPPEESIRQFVLQHFPLARQRQVGSRESLLETGILDSLGILDVVTFLEREFQIVVDDEELQPDNFSSIVAMSAYVAQKRVAGALKAQR